MRRVRYYEYGAPEVLTLEEADIPTAGPGQVLIRAEAIGANFVDTKFRRGRASGLLFQRPLPGILTGDVVGVVDAVGSDVEDTLLGRRVAALAEDAFADYALADARWLAPVPDGLDLGAASMLPMGAPVALRVLRTGQLAKGETVLIHAAAGGIGHLAVQLAKTLGAGTVIATASSPSKLDFARAWRRHRHRLHRRRLARPGPQGGTTGRGRRPGLRGRCDPAPEHRRPGSVRPRRDVRRRERRPGRRAGQKPLRPQVIGGVLAAHLTPSVAGGQLHRFDDQQERGQDQVTTQQAHAQFQAG